MFQPFYGTKIRRRPWIVSFGTVVDDGLKQIETGNSRRLMDTIRRRQRATERQQRQFKQLKTANLKI